MGNATPVVSPEATDPAGDVVYDGTEFEMLVSTGEVLAGLTPSSLLIGSAEDFRSEGATEVDIAEDCTGLAVAEDKFVLACGSQVHVYDPVDPTQVETTETVADATTAVLADGALITANANEEDLTIYRDGEDPKTLGAAHGTDQLISVERADAPTSVVRIFRENTTIQNVDLERDRQGGTLRVGLGVGQGSAGEDGIVVVSDSMGNQLGIYLYDAVIRLQQTAPTPEGPWGVAWDAHRDWAWVTSTGENVAIGHAISDGVPQPREEFNTIADAQHITVLNDGTIVTASASGDGIQLVTL